MKPREMKPGIFWVGAVDWDRRLFDALIPLPDGTSYNAYLIKGSDKTALIDSVDPAMSAVLFDHLAALKIDKIDYIIANHAEQDHSGTLPQLLEKFHGVKLVCTPKCRELLIELLDIPEERFETVNDRDTIPLGNRTLEFIYAPWVHWPETMLTYLREDKILFSCDFLGSHLATTDLYLTDEGKGFESAKRYYAEIMMPFHTNIERHLERLKEYQIDIIAPSHGPMYDKPEFILNAYRSWVLDKPRNIVVLPYISMHGSTRRMVDYMVGALAANGVKVQEFDLSVTDIGKLAMALVDAGTIVLGSPTVLTGPHPAVAYAAFLANALRPKAKFASIIGSYGWGGRMVEQLAAALPNLKLEVLPPVLCKGLPRDTDFTALDNLAATITQKHKENGFT
jgi:flavorubredoxin